MKNVFVIICLFLCTAVVAQNNCSQYYATKPGRQLIHKVFDKRDNHSHTTEYNTEYTSSSGITMNFTLSDEEGEHITGGVLELGCSNGTTYLAPESIMTDLLSQYEDIDYTIIAGDRLAIPNDLHIGLELPDASASIRIDAQILTANYDIDISDRKVVRREEVVTPAGTYDCYVITYKNRLSGRLVSKTYECTDWIAKNIGTVKQETYKQNGRLMTRSVLNQLSDL